MSGTRKLVLPRTCAGCSLSIDAGAYVYEETEVPGVVFHGIVCAAIYACRMLRGGKTKLPPTRKWSTAAS